MSTISEKITQLKNVKSEIKQAIIDAGIAVPDSATFLNYADLIRSFEKGGLSYKTSLIGTNASLSQLEYTITIQDEGSAAL